MFFSKGVSLNALEAVIMIKNCLSKQITMWICRKAVFVSYGQIVKRVESRSVFMRLC